jgi:hypothetical protein
MAISDAIGGMMHDPEAQSPPPKKVHTMVITRVPGKGHHVTHHHTHPQHHPAHSQMVHAPEGNEGNLDNLHDHLEENMGEPNEGEQACEDGHCD